MWLECSACAEETGFTITPEYRGSPDGLEPPRPVEVEFEWPRCWNCGREFDAADDRRAIDLALTDDSWCEEPDWPAADF